MDTKYKQNMRVTGKKVKRKAASARKPRKERQIQIQYTPAKPFNRNRFLLRLATVAAVVLALVMGMSIFFKVNQVYVSGAEKDKAAKLFSNYMKIGYYSVWILGVAVLITSEQVISLLYTEEYLRGTSVFVIYVVDSMIKFASMHLILTAGGKTNLIMVYSLGAMLLNLVLNILMYAMVGMTGPAWATLISTAVYTFLILRSSIKLIGVGWKAVLDVKDMLSFGAVLAITGVAFAMVNRLLLDGGMHKYTAMLISAGGFGFTNLLLNFRRIWRALKATNDFHL